MVAAAIIGGAASLGSAFLTSNAATRASSQQVGLGQQALQAQTGLGEQGIQTLLDLFNQAKGFATSGLPTAQNLISSGTDVMNYGKGVGTNIMDLARGASSDIFNLGRDTAGSLFNTAGDIMGTGGNILGGGVGVAGSAADTLKNLLTPGANMTNTLSQIPGFQFLQDWGQKGISAQATTRGLGGNALAAGAQFATGTAQQGFGTIVNALQSLLSGGTGLANVGAGVLGTGANVLGTGGNVLGNLTGTGANLLSGLTGTGAGTLSNILGTGGQLQQGGTNALTNLLTSIASGATWAGGSAFGGLNTLGSNLGQTYTGIGQAQAQGTLGQANAFAGGLQGAGNSITNAMLLSKLLPGSTGGGGGIFGR
jgi:hypothetical protein